MSVWTSREVCWSRRQPPCEFIPRLPSSSSTVSGSNRRHTNVLNTVESASRPSPAQGPTVAPRETHRLGHRLYLLESVAKMAVTQETYHPRFVKRASRKLKCRRISNVGGLQPNRRSLRLRHSGGASPGGSSSIVFGGGWGPQSMSGCRLNGGSQAVNDLFGSGETTQAATSRRLRPGSPRLDPTFRSVAGERGSLSCPHNCDVAPRQLNEIAVSDRAAFAGLTQFSATHYVSQSYHNPILTWLRTRRLGEPSKSPRAFSMSLRAINPRAVRQLLLVSSLNLVAATITRNSHVNLWLTIADAEVCTTGSG